MDVTKSYEFMGFGAIDVTKPYELVLVCGGVYYSGGGITLCYAIVLPGRSSGFRAGVRPDSFRDAGRPAGGPISRCSRLERNPARKLDFRPGSTIVNGGEGSTFVWLIVWRLFGFSFWRLI
jgi:hypothetical protein